MSGILRCAVIDCRDVDAASYGTILSHLSDDRRERAESFSVFSDKVMSAVAGLCMEGLAESLGTNVLKLSNGKPMFGREDLHLSVSHSGSFVVIAWSDSPVGVDVQKVIPMGNIARRILSPKEITDMGSMDDTDLVKVWTRKESYVKMTGEGMSRPFDSFDEDILDPGYSFFTYGIEEDMVLTVCCRSDTVPKTITVRVTSPDDIIRAVSWNS